MVTRNCDELPKATFLLAANRPDYREDNMSDITLSQFSASSSSNDSDFIDVHDEPCDPPHVEEEPVKAGDPSWVARPRNAFIIFRCEYARRHSKMGKGIKRGTGPISEKSLSKRAAEAWHQLPSQEKNHFKILADQERSEHARLHPDYRFRPAKRILPPRIIRSRPASSDSIKHRSGDGATVKPNSSWGSSPLVSMCSADISNPYSQVTCEPLYSTYSLGRQQGSTNRCRLNSSYSEATKNQTSMPADSCNPLGPLYSHLEGVLPPIPERGRTMELCPLHHPMPKRAATPTPMLTDWDSISTENPTTNPDSKERDSLPRTIWFSEDPFENICMDMQYSPCGNPHLRRLCNDFLDIYHPTAVSPHPQVVFSSYIPTGY